jgi:DNA polymerase-4
VFLPSDRDAYDSASAEVWSVVKTLPVVVEVWGWDEAFVGSTEEAADPVRLARTIRRAVTEATGFTCCVGIGDNKVRAKTATGFAKAPDGALPQDAAGVFELTQQNWLELMGDRPTAALWGVGAKTAGKLEELGISTVRQLAAADVEQLRARFGPKTGAWIASLGRGLGDRTVTSAPWVPKGRSREVTLEHDVVERPEIERHLREIAAAVVGDVAGGRRQITVRFVPFVTRTRVHKLPTPTLDRTVVADAAVALLDRLELGRGIRLLGVRVELAEPG